MFSQSYLFDANVNAVVIVHVVIVIVIVIVAVECFIAELVAKISIMLPLC